MFRLRKKTEDAFMENDAEKVAAEAEGYYRSGKLQCAEAVLAAIMRNYMPDTGEEVVRLAAGFGGGSGAGCICGAVAGGTMAFGLVFADNRKQAQRLTKELHRWFKEEYGATCCKIILQTHKKICYELTGKVAGKVAEMLETHGARHALCE